MCKHCRVLEYSYCTRSHLVIWTLKCSPHSPDLPTVFDLASFRLFWNKSSIPPMSSIVPSCVSAVSRCLAVRPATLTTVQENGCKIKHLVLKACWGGTLRGLNSIWSCWLWVERSSPEVYCQLYSHECVDDATPSWEQNHERHLHDCIKCWPKVNRHDSGVGSSTGCSSTNLYANDMGSIRGSRIVFSWGKMSL